MISIHSFHTNVITNKMPVITASPISSQKRNLIAVFIKFPSFFSRRNWVVHIRYHEEEKLLFCSERSIAVANITDSCSMKKCSCCEVLAWRVTAQSDLTPDFEFGGD